MDDEPHDATARPPTCWVLSEGHVGMANQALGLAEALGLAPIVKTWRPAGLLRRLPPRLWTSGVLGTADRDCDPLHPPWPDLVISCGKRAAGAAALIRSRSAGATFAVHIQTPPLPRSAFDLLVIPAHDGVTGDNVVVTEAAVHRVTRDRLTEAATGSRGRFDHLPRPLVAVLVGGSNSRHRLTPEITRRVGDRLARLAADQGAGLIVTASRRTGRENEAILREALAGTAAEVWDGTGENPYFAMLALADAIVVTEDSVSMASEALATGKPVHVVALEGRSRRIDRFHRALRVAGYTRPFDGTLAEWHYDPPADTARAAAVIRERLAARGFVW